MERNMERNMKVLYTRPGAKDQSGNPVGFKAEPGSPEAKRLMLDGFVPLRAEGEDEGPVEMPPLTAEELQAMDIKALKALAKELKIPRFGIMHEVQLVAAIMSAQAEQSAQEQEGDDGANDNGGAADTPPQAD